MLACGFSGKLYLFSFFFFFGEISEHRKKITKDAKQMNISFIRERHWILKRALMQMSNDVINLLRGIWYLKIEKAGEKKSIRERGGGNVKE